MHTSGIEDDLLKQDYVIIGGGIGTELVRLGFNDVYDDQLWSSRLLLTNPESVKQAHLNFLQAGADIVETNSYQANVQFLRKILNLSENEAINVLRKSVTIAQDAVDEFWESCSALHKQNYCKPVVAGSIGPYGATLCDGSEYSGDYVKDFTEKELMDWHRPRFQVFSDAGIELFAIVTIPAVAEGKALIKLLNEFPSCKAWLCFACKDSGQTCYGDSLCDILDPVLTSAQIIGIGMNCTNPADIEAGLLQLQPLRHSKKLVVMPNSGEPWDKELKWHGKETMISITSYIPQWMELGAEWIGGCCRVEPKEIAAIRDTVRETWVAKVPALKQ